MTEKLRINSDRLHQSLTELAEIGALPGGGVCRLAFTAEDKAGRDYVENRMRRLGLDVRIDGIGNMIGFRMGKKDTPVVMTGSHLDTVATGGCFDGCLGVLAGLEVFEVLAEQGISTEYPLALASFANEEGVRFRPDMMGSMMLSGDLDLERARSSLGTDGTTLGENLERTGYAGRADLRALPVHCYVELHIEQGPILDTEGVTIAAVEGVQGISWLEYTLAGQANHAGTTPLHRRRDAGYGAGKVVCLTRKLAREIDNLRATAGSITLVPNLINVIAETATVTIDLRHPDATRLSEAEASLRAWIFEMARDENLKVYEKSLATVEGIRFDEEIVSLIEMTARRLGYPVRRMYSGAGHDAQILGACFPAAMIFVPSRDGISHNVHEYTDPVDVEAGANVLLHTLLKLADS